jgi:hypothetical protein
MRTVALLLLTAAVMQAAAIDGVIVNGATGKPQPGATVTLFKVGQNGPEMLESVKSGPDGKFALNQELRGPRLVQAAFAGVTYNQMLPPGAPSNNVTIPVYPSSPQRGAAKVQEHMVLFEHASGQLSVSESYVFNNPGKSTWNDPAKGTLQFVLPEAAQGKVEVNVLAPQGMPIRRAPEKTGQPGVYKVDFPIKPGESRIDIAYVMPFDTPGKFQERVLVQSTDTKLVAPVGITLKGDSLKELGKEPRTQAALYLSALPKFDFTIEGSGSLQQQQAQGAADESATPQLMQVLPKLFAEVNPADGFWASVGAVKWLLLLIVGILALAFTLLYRLPVPEVKAAGPTGEKNARRRG